jgi:hypothetical protein
VGLQPRKSHGPHPSKATPTLKATQKHGSFHCFRSFSKKIGKVELQPLPNIVLFPCRRKTVRATE